jgi:tRNA A37 methylthiotransferase MiaB
MRSLKRADMNTAKLLNTKVCIIANGCHENHMDAELLKNYLTNEFNVKTVDNYQHADFVLIQGCSVTQHMENESKQIIRYIKEKKEDKSIVVMGCLSKFRPECKIDQSNNILPMDEIEQNLYRMGPYANKYAVNSLYDNPPAIKEFLKNNKKNTINYYFGHTNNGSVRNLIDSHLYNALLFCKKEFEKRIDVYNNHTFCIKASTGCTGKCSYCSIRVGRGKIRSKSIDDIVKEFNKGINLGYKHFGLIGTDLGDYGKDINLDLYELLNRILETKGDYKIKLRNVSPRWLIPNYSRLITLLKSKKIIYLQSPIQSGSDEILKLMHRGYAASDFLHACKKVKASFPGIFLRTQIIVGFPTEDTTHFNESKKVLKSGLFDYIDIFRFTKRKGTGAAEIFPEVPQSIIMKRYREIFLKTLFSKPIRKLRAVQSIYYDSIRSSF